MFVCVWKQYVLLIGLPQACDNAFSKQINNSFKFFCKIWWFWKEPGLLFSLFIIFSLFFNSPTLQTWLSKRFHLLFLSLLATLEDSPLDAFSFHKWQLLQSHDQPWSCKIALNGVALYFSQTRRSSALLYTLRVYRYTLFFPSKFIVVYFILLIRDDIFYTCYRLQNNEKKKKWRRRSFCLLSVKLVWATTLLD